MSEKSSASSYSPIYFLFCILTAMIGYHMHGSLFWAIVDFIFTIIVWLKWIIYHEVTLTIIKETFHWFFK